MPRNFKHVVALSTLFTLAHQVTATFDPNSNSNVAVYWGQGPNQERLADYCRDNSIDIVAVAFVNIFPDQGPGGWPGDNFGNACGFGVYEHNGVMTDLLDNCPLIGPDIKTCQEQYGKKVLLSIGGAIPGDGYLFNQSSARYFADFLWGAFGPSKPTWINSNLPRPFGDSVVDGFDFDIESFGVPPGKESFGWATMIDRFKNDLYPTDPSKDYYISGAPVCQLPDAHLSKAIATSWFDFVFIQFYDDPSCAARVAVDQIQNTPTSGQFNFPQWVQAKSLNPNSKLFIGLPAAPDASAEADYYLSPEEVSLVIQKYRPMYPNRFGGIMLWDATRSADNPINGNPYVNAVKADLELGGTRNPIHQVPQPRPRPSSSQSPPPAPAPATPTPTLTHTPIPSTTPTPTSIPSSSPSSSPSTHLPPCAEGTIRCPDPGAVICVGSDMFGLCDINYCAIPQLLAAGTYCRQGSIARRFVA